MRIEELQAVCTEAAAQLVGRAPRPLVPAVVLPLPDRTRVTQMTDFPDDDGARFDVLSRYATEVVRPASAPCFGFVAEATLDAGDGEIDVVVVAYGARQHPTHVVAAPISDDGLDVWTEPEELDPTAMPFLAPLRHAVDDVRPDETPGGTDVLGGLS